MNLMTRYVTFIGIDEDPVRLMIHDSFEDARRRWLDFFVNWAARDECDTCRGQAALEVKRLIDLQEDDLPWAGEVEGDDYYIAVESRDEWINIMR